MKRLSSLLLTSLCLFASSSQAQTSSSDKELAQSCVEKYQQNNKDEALADCSKAIELNARSTDAYVVRAVILGERSNVEGAIADLDKASVLDPHNPTILKVRAALKLLKGDADGSIADYDKAVTLDPSPKLYEGRALAHIAKGNFDKAVDDLNVAIEKSPGQVKLYSMRALAKFKKKDWGGATVDYNTAIKLDPKPPEAYAYRGLALLNQGKDVEAQEDFDKFLELAPGKKASLEKLIETTKRERAVRQ